MSRYLHHHLVAFDAYFEAPEATTSPEHSKALPCRNVVTPPMPWTGEYAVCHRPVVDRVADVKAVVLKCAGTVGGVEHRELYAEKMDRPPPGGRNVRAAARTQPSHYLGPEAPARVDVKSRFDPTSAHSASSGRRSISFRPPQIPCCSLERIAYSRQSLRTPQLAQIAFAFDSRMSLSSLRSKCDGGKKSAVFGPRHAAFACHIASACRTLIHNPPVPRQNGSASSTLTTRGTAEF